MGHSLAVRRGLCIWRRPLNIKRLGYGVCNVSVSVIVVGVASAENMTAVCRIDKNSGIGEIGGIIEFTQEVCLHFHHRHSGYVGIVGYNALD